MYKNLWQTPKSDIFTMLQRELDRRESSPDYPYWLMEDAGSSYCLECIKAQKPNFDFNDDYGDFFDGGFEQEEDGSCRCEKCGKLLFYTLTDYGVNSEIATYHDYQFDWNNADECFEIGRVAYGAFYAKQKRQALKAMLKGKNCPMLTLRDTPIPMRGHS